MGWVMWTSSATLSVHLSKVRRRPGGLLVELYVKVGRMRILSSPEVIESADLIAQRIVDTYLASDKTFLELREMTNNGSIDLFRGFSETCRAEFESLRAQF